MARENDAAVNQTATSAQSLETLASELQGAVARFRT